MRPTILYILFTLFAINSGVAEVPYACRSGQIPTSWATQPVVGDITKSSIDFTELGRSWIRLTFVNNTAFVIKAAAVVVQYLDQQGRIIEEVPLKAATEPADKAFQPPFVVEHLQIWKHPIRMGESAFIGGVYDGIRTASCPVSARVTFAMIQYVDGSIRQLAAPSWYLGPLPTYIPTMPNPSFPLTAPSQLLISLRISSTGQVKSCSPKNSQQTEIAGWVAREMKQHWRFHPALRNGKAVDSQLTVLFIVEDHAQADLSNMGTNSFPITVIHLFPRRGMFQHDNSSLEFVVEYGELLERSAID